MRGTLSNDVILPRALYDELIAHAQEEAPLECCGVIAFKGTMEQLAYGRHHKTHDEPVAVYRATNAAASEVRYEIDGFEQFELMAAIDRNRQHIGAIYHSHTHADPYPSLMDIETAFYPDALYVIVGIQDRDFPEVRAFRIRDGKVEEEALEVRG